MDRAEVERMRGEIEAHRLLIQELLEHACADLENVTKALLADTLEHGIPADAMSEEQRAKKRILEFFVKEVDHRTEGLTFRRKAQGQDLLDEYAGRLRKEESMDRLEGKLRDRWQMGAGRFRTVIIDMFDNHPEYKDLAVYVMDQPSPPSEYHRCLREHREESP